MFATKKIITLTLTMSIIFSLFACSSQNNRASIGETPGSENGSATSSTSTDESSTSSNDSNTTLTTTTATTAAIFETKPDFSGEVSDLATYSTESRATLLVRSEELKADLIESKLSTLQLDFALTSLERFDNLVQANPAMQISESLPMTKALDGLTKTLEALGTDSALISKVEALNGAIQSFDSKELLTEITDQITAIEIKSKLLLGVDSSSFITSLENLKTSAASVNQVETLFTLQNQVFTMATLIADEGPTGMVKAEQIATLENLKISERSLRESLLTEGRDIKKMASTLEADGVDVKTLNTRTKLFLSLLANGSTDEVDSAATSLSLSLRKTARNTSDVDTATALTTAADSILNLIAN